MNFCDWAGMPCIDTYHTFFWWANVSEGTADDGIPEGHVCECGEFVYERGETKGRLRKLEELDA